MYTSINIILLSTLLIVQNTLAFVIDDTITWSTCSVDVRGQFQSDFPEWVDPASGSGRRRELLSRRLAANPITTDTVETKLFSQQSFDNVEIPPQDITVNSTVGIGLAGLRRSNRKPSPIRRPPPGELRAQYLAALASASNCLDCSTGCCDAADVLFDCGTQSAPLRYNDSTSPVITIQVYRIRLVGTKAPALGSSQRKHYWLLQGGPGGSGLTILFLSISMLQYATDIYVPDHRGTGFSSLLDCPTQQSTSSTSGTAIAPSEVSACVSYNSQLNNPVIDYTSSNAARDLERFLARARADANPASVLVHGISYGTRWAQRFLQLFPAVADKVVIEGVVSKSMVFNNFAVGSQSAGDRLLQKCPLSTTCTSFLGTGGVATLVNTIINQGINNYCSVLLLGKTFTTTDIVTQVQEFLYKGLTFGVEAYGSEIVDFRVFLVAWLYRWSLCTTQGSDYRSFVAGLTWVLSTNGGLTGSSPGSMVNGNRLRRERRERRRNLLPTAQELDSDLLYQTVVYSDLWTFPIESASTYTTENAQVYFGVVSDYVSNYKAYTDAWVNLKSPPEPALQNLAPTNVSSALLIINGELDGQTPRASAYATFNDIQVRGTKYITVQKDGGHHSSGRSCGAAALAAFVTSTTPVSCGLGQFDAVQGLEGDFKVPSDYAVTLAGATDVWTGDVTSTFCSGVTTEISAIRCFDYCLLQAKTVGDECNCVQSLGGYLTSVTSISQPTSRCTDWVILYANSLRDTNLDTTCLNSCSIGVANGDTGLPGQSGGSPSLGTAGGIIASLGLTLVIVLFALLPCGGLCCLVWLGIVLCNRRSQSQRGAVFSPRPGMGVQMNGVMNNNNIPMATVIGVSNTPGTVIGMTTPSRNNDGPILTATAVPSTAVTMEGDVKI